MLNKLKHSAGFTLMEMLISLGVMALMTVGMSGLIDLFSTNMRTSMVGQQTATFGNAMQAYVKDNYSAVSALATATTPALIRASTLIATGYLQSGYSITNSYNQNICGLVLQPVAGQLNAMVVTEGGTAINDFDLGAVAGTIGAAGGGIYSTSSSTVTGAKGGWSMATGNYANANQAGLRCDGTAGTIALSAGHPMMALWFNGGDTTAGVLYRNVVPGQPQLNHMNTPIVMNSIQVSGAACTSVGAIAQDGQGAVISCQNPGPIWKPTGSAYWKDPVANYASLPGAGDGNGTVRMTLDIGRAFMFNGASWAALAVDQNGDLSVPGTATVGIANITTASSAGTVCAAEGNLVRDTESLATGLLICRAGRYVTVGGAGTGSTPGAPCLDEGKLARDVTPGSGYLLVCRSGIYEESGGLTAVTDGAACTTNGAIGKTAAGVSEICQGNVWVPIAARIGTLAFIDAIEVTVTGGGAPGMQMPAPVPKPACLANGLPKLYLVPKSDDNLGYVNHYATDMGTYWNAYAVDGANVGINSVMLAESYCYYS